jgi:hypothetical protein
MSSIESIKSRIERVRKEESWNDYEWALSSLELAVEALDWYKVKVGGYSHHEFICHKACGLDLWEDAGNNAKQALAKIQGEDGEGKWSS